jgi:hypothetical protein
MLLLVIISIIYMWELAIKGGWYAVLAHLGTPFILFAYAIHIFNTPHPFIEGVLNAIIQAVL